MHLFHFPHPHYPTKKILFSLSLADKWCGLTQPLWSKGVCPIITLHIWEKALLCKRDTSNSYTFELCLGVLHNSDLPFLQLSPSTYSTGSSNTIIQTALQLTTVPLEGKVKMPSVPGENVRKTITDPLRDETLIPPRRRALHKYLKPSCVRSLVFRVDWTFPVWPATHVFTSQTLSRHTGRHFAHEQGASHNWNIHRRFSRVQNYCQLKDLSFSVGKETPSKS